MKLVDITPVLSMIISIIVFIIVSFLFPTVRDFLKSRMTQTSWSTLVSIVSILVEGAEQLIKGDKKGAERRDFVMNTVKARCEKEGTTFNENEVRGILEKAWSDLKSKQTQEVAIETNTPLILAPLDENPKI